MITDVVMWNVHQFLDMMRKEVNFSYLKIMGVDEDDAAE